MTDFEDMILRRRLEDSEDSHAVFETLRNQNRVYVDNPSQLVKTEVIGLNYNQLKGGRRVRSRRSQAEGDEGRLKESDVVMVEKETESGSKRPPAPIKVENSGVHPVFQNKRQSADGVKKWRSRKSEGKGERTIDPDSPNNAKNIGLDFDYNSYHRKIEIQQVKPEKEQSVGGGRKEEPREDQPGYVLSRNQSQDMSMRNVGQLRAEGEWA